MSAPPPLFDRPTLDRRRTRAAAAPALFLQEHVALGCEERLQEVNRGFTAPAIVSPWPQVWANRMPGAVVVPDTDVLALDAGAYDLVIHALSLHWANDPVGQLVQCRHALRPDGMLLATLFGGQTLQELRRCLAQAEAEVTGGLSPRVAPMGEIRDLGGLLQRAGLAMPVADSETIPVSYESALHLMRDLRAMGETNVMTARLTRPSARAVFVRAAAIYAENFGADDGRITATFEVVTLTGWAPADSQPKPLRPGSAQARLADALNAAETPLDPGGD